MSKVKPTRRKRTNELTRGPRRDSAVIYIRIPRELLDQIRERASSLGYPHTITSVATQAIQKGMIDPHDH